jgi:hypothetical protein
MSWGVRHPNPQQLTSPELVKDCNVSKQRIGIALFAITLLSIFWITPAQAQVQGGGWSEPYRLSSEDGKASEGYLVADQYGYVHCFWAETLFEDQRTIIKYARFDGTTWTKPNDIYVTARGIEQVSTVVDKHGTLHIVWTEGVSGPVYYTYAPATSALSAQNWAQPLRIDIPAGIVQFRIDSRGVFHILYVNRTERLGVYYVRSKDQGETWSEPVWLDPDIPPYHTPQDLTFELDDSDGLHAVWNYGALVNDIPSSASVRYTHSFDGGDTWSVPFAVDQYGGSGPRMILQGQSVHVIWAAGSGVPPQLHRFHSFSTDGGQTWSLPMWIFGDLQGQAWDGLALDGAGRVHFFGQLRYPMGIYHAYWDQTRWSKPLLVYLIAVEGSEEGIGDRVHAHFTLPVVRAGNQLVLTFTDGPADPNRRLFVTYRTLDDILPLEPVATPVEVTIPATASSPTTTDPTPTPIRTPTVQSFDPAEGQPLGRVPAPDLAIRVAIVPTLLVLGVTMIIQLLNRRKH